MPAVVVLVAVLALFALGYRYYSSYLARRVYGLDPNYVTPAHRYSDGVDFVPTNRYVVFSHHFISVAGAAPIVGPAVAVFWGWGPALLWVVLGTIFAAGVHDFGALAVSVRHRAKSIGTLAGEVVSRRAGTLFLIIIFFLLTLVNAVFSVVIANLFVSTPSVVLPTLVTIPLAIGVGQYVYRTRSAALLPSLVVLLLVYASIPLGLLFPITIDPLAAAVGLTPKTLWIILVFGYAFAASRLPVWLLLQPRDYINQQQMLVALAVILLGVAVGFDWIVAPLINDVPDGSPPWFPLLFITIACGAISGFHSLVSSGTTAKQIDRETDARFVGYLGAVGEGTLALCAILACTAGVAATRADWDALYTDYATASGSATDNFVNGVANFASHLGIPETVGVRGDHQFRVHHHGHGGAAATLHRAGDRGDRPDPAAGTQPHLGDPGGGGGAVGVGAHPGRLRVRHPLAAVRHHQPAHRRTGVGGDRSMGHQEQPQPARGAHPPGVPARHDLVGAGPQPGPVCDR